MPKHKSDAVLKLRIEGPGVRSGSISVPDLLRICESAQNAVNRQAEAMQGKVSLRPGPRTANVIAECTLELTGIEKGSSVLPFRLANPQQRIPGSMCFGEDVIVQVGQIIQDVGSRRKNVRTEYDAGVLDSLTRLGEVFGKKSICKIEWSVPASPGRKALRAMYNPTVREKIAHLAKPKLEAQRSVEGVLEMADFKALDKRCRIHPPIGQPIVCAFDSEIEDQIYEALRKPVRVSGTARINPHSGKVEELHIKQIGVIEQLAMGAKDFFAGHTLLELAEIQGVEPLLDPKTLLGGLPPDEDVDQFLEEIYAGRTV